MSGTVCVAKGCAQFARRGPFCPFHWDLLPAELRLAWRERKRAAPWSALLSRMVAAVERHQYGDRLL